MYYIIKETVVITYVDDMLLCKLLDDWNEVFFEMNDNIKG